MSTNEPPINGSPSEEAQVPPEVEVSISGVAFGPYPLEKLREYLMAGLISSTDPARWVGSDEWASAGDFLGDLEDQVPAPFVFQPEADPVVSAPEKEKTEPTVPAPEEVEPEPTDPVRLAPEPSGPVRLLAPEPPVAPKPLVQSRPLTGPLIRARFAATTSSLPVGSGRSGTRPLGGLKSQILARTSQEPLRPLPSARPELAVTTPFKFVPLRRTAPVAPRDESPATLLPKTISFANSPAEITSAPEKRLDGFVAGRPPWLQTEKAPEIVATPAVSEPPPEVPAPAAEPEPQAEPPSPPPEPIVEAPRKEPAPLRVAVEPRPQLTETLSFAPPNPDPIRVATESRPQLTETLSFAPTNLASAKKMETGMIRRHALPASKTGSMPVLPVFTIIAPVKTPSDQPPGGPEPVKKPVFILPPRPVAARPVADADSVIAVQLPEKRTQMIKAMPGLPIKSSEQAEATAEQAGLTRTPLPGVTNTTATAPLPAPARTAQVKKPASSGVTLASVATPPPDEVKMERPASPRGMANLSALAATTVMPSSAPTPPETPKRASADPTAMRTGFGPPSRLPPGDLAEESATPAPPVNLAETRRAALKQSRLKRKRQGLIFAGAGVIFVLAVCYGIYRYTTFSSETAAPVATEKQLPEVAPAKPAPPKATAPAPAQTPLPKPPAAAVPSNPQVPAFIIQGQALQTKGDYDGAIAQFNQAITLDPKYPQTYSYRAAAKMAKGDTTGAMADDNQLLTLDADNAAGFCQRGFVKQAMKDPDGALADYSRAVQLDPKSYVAFYNRGLIEGQTGKADAAIADYNQALILNPKLAGAFFNRGNAKMDKNDTDGAIADYTSALAIDPKIALAYCDRALAEQNSGNLNAAITDYNQGLAIDPKITMAFYNRGLIEEQRDDLDGCVRDSTAAIELNPDNAQAYYNRGLALQAKGNLEAAAIDLQKFDELAPKNAYADYARLYLWVIASEQSQKAAANRQLSSVLTSTWNAEPSQLPSKIAAFLLDQISESDLMGAVSTDPKKSPGERCEALYFDGMKQLLNGKKQAATICLNQCLDTGQRDYCEFILAQAQLQTMSP